MHWSNDEMVTIPRWGPVAVEFGCTADNAHSAELQDLQDNNQRWMFEDLNFKSTRITSKNSWEKKQQFIQLFLFLKR